jgi:hypothetical protein
MAGLVLGRCGFGVPGLLTLSTGAEMLTLTRLEANTSSF